MDHPRVCGEHFQFVVPAAQSAGSSPRMRGTRMAMSVLLISPGIIPAYAGNTLTPINILRHSRDHPRVCGEHYAFDRPVVRSTGSSPRMRGTPGRKRDGTGTRGIIPAYAGNTPRNSRLRTVCRDHPRVCGEHTYHVDAPEAIAGSSPRMRGTRAAFR